MPYFISNIQPNVKKLQNYLAVPNNFVNTQIVLWVCAVLSRKFFRLLSLKQNIIPPTFVGAFGVYTILILAFINIY
ncbi:hypothetical protein AWR41_05980 [Riemerella anatipestifer]|nr:hypothetical protein [Riemerella anatipestifer]OBP41729.1 hypothetical protein AWR41_05980 [Riemerella anatipestifer]